MELILTDEEKAAATWTELDDESVGKVAKSLMFKIKEYGDENKRLFTMSAAIALCSLVAETNADKSTITVEGLTKQGRHLGNWKLTIKRLNNNGNKVKD